MTYNHTAYRTTPAAGVQYTHSVTVTVAQGRSTGATRAAAYRKFRDLGYTVRPSDYLQLGRSRRRHDGVKVQSVTLRHPTTNSR